MNPRGRLSTIERVRDAGEAEAARQTEVRTERTRSIITHIDSPDIPFDRSINPYRGCEHGCAYCYARPSHAYVEMSPGLDFESKVVAKPDAAVRLFAELARESYRCAPVALGSNTDPYQPVERRLRITREVVEVLASFHHPLSITSKSALVERDIDLLAPMSRAGLARVMISINSLDRDLARRLEPRAATPDRRLAAVRALSEAGVAVGIFYAPIIPGLNDPSIEAVLEAAREAGALAAHFELVRLPYELDGIFSDWLATHVPERRTHVLSLIRSTHGGALCGGGFGKRMHGSGPYADMLQQRFERAHARLGFAPEMPPLDTSRFGRPAEKGEQLKLF